jgi:hypothetical protein
MRMKLPTLNLVLNVFLYFDVKFVWGAKVHQLMGVNHHNVPGLF